MRKNVFVSRENNDNDLGTAEAVARKVVGTNSRHVLNTLSRFTLKQIFQSCWLAEVKQVHKNIAEYGGI